MLCTWVYCMLFKSVGRLLRRKEFLQSAVDFYNLLNRYVYWDLFIIYPYGVKHIIWKLNFLYARPVNCVACLYFDIFEVLFSLLFLLHNTPKVSFRIKYNEYITALFFFY